MQAFTLRARGGGKTQFLKAWLDSLTPEERARVIQVESPQRPPRYPYPVENWFLQAYLRGRAEEKERGEA